MAIIGARFSVWEALAGRAAGRPLGPGDPGVWEAVAERVNPAKARPKRRAGVEEAWLTSVRGSEYVMLRSPDGSGRQVCYVRLSREEVELTRLMDGTRTMARLVAEFVRISGRLAPDQVRRVVADLAGNRMLDELPVDAFLPLQRLRRRPWPVRLGRGLLAFVQGRRIVVANIDPLVGFVYRAGGRLLFTRPVAVLLGVIAVAGLGAFGWQWWAGEQSVFLTGHSYFIGAAVLLGLNVLALACHELGHGLATKRAGRRVAVGGFLVYFGIPSVFVDTSDVWMAGRRARLRTTAAGPATGLVLAGTSAIVGLLDPALAPWCFKLSFAWYVNALFNLNPFLALDGYYLLMDWLEVPNLRARGIAWVTARLLRRPPRFRTLDREGRLVALYGMLAVGWLVIAANIAYRVWADRLAGLTIGLWRHGWVARVLLFVLAAALAAPMVYALAGWLRRRGRRVRERLRERHAERDQPRRLAVLGSSSLRELPPDTLTRLSSVATWVHPRPGQQVVFAGAAQPQVYTVVEGALEGRAPGDPSGSVRERVGAGGIVGLGPALTGTPPVLAWHATGTKLLALPAHAVADAVRPGSRLTSSQGEIDALLAQAPALAALSAEDRLGLARAARPVWLSPGAAVTLFDTDTAQLIVSGSLILHSGDVVGRGALLGPGQHDGPVQMGHARSAVHLLMLPAVSGLALLLGASASRLRAEAAGLLPGRPPTFGVHPPASYPPLAGPPGPPPPRGDVADRIDRRFEGKLRWLLLLVLLLGLGLTGANLLPAVAWSEMADDQVLLHVGQGHATAIVGGVQVRMRAGDDVYLGEGDSVEVADRSGARLTYRGGAISQLCAGSAVTVGALSTSDRPLVPTGTLRIERGLVVTDTATRSTAFRPLVAVQESASGKAVSSGRSRFAMAATGPLLADGALTFNGTPLQSRGGSLGCGGQAVAAGSPASSEPSSAPFPAGSAGASPSASASASSAPSASASAGPSQSTAATRTPGPATPGPGAPPPDATVPQIAAGPSASPTGIYTTADGTTPTDGDPASSITSTIAVTVQDAVDSAAALVVTIRYRLVPEGGAAGGWQTVTLAPGATSYRIGPFQQDFTGVYRTYVDVEATVRDAAGNTSAPSTVSQLITVRDYVHG